MPRFQTINSPDLSTPSGYADAVRVETPGRLLFLGGHVAYDRHRRICHPGDLPAQVGLALRNLRATLEAAGGAPEHLVRMTIYTVDARRYRSLLKEIGEVWRRELGRTYPSMTLLGISALYDAEALVEIDGVAVLP